MKAFVEITGLIVRAGPDCDAYGAPYEYACAGVASGGRLEIKGLSAGRMTRAHVKAALAALAPLGFESIVYQHKGKFTTLFSKDQSK